MHVLSVDLEEKFLEIQVEKGEMFRVNFSDIDALIALLGRGKSAVEFLKVDHFPIGKISRPVELITSHEMMGPYKGLRCSWCSAVPRWKRLGSTTTHLACDTHKSRLTHWHEVDGDDVCDQCHLGATWVDVAGCLSCDGHYLDAFPAIYCDLCGVAPVKIGQTRCDACRVGE